MDARDIINSLTSLLADVDETHNQLIRMWPFLPSMVATAALYGHESDQHYPSTDQFLAEFDRLLNVLWSGEFFDLKEFEAKDENDEAVSDFWTAEKFIEWVAETYKVAVREYRGNDDVKPSEGYWVARKFFGDTTPVVVKVIARREGEHDPEGCGWIVTQCGVVGHSLLKEWALIRPVVL